MLVVPLSRAFHHLRVHVVEPARLAKIRSLPGSLEEQVLGNLVAERGRGVGKSMGSVVGGNEVHDNGVRFPEGNWWGSIWVMNGRCSAVGIDGFVGRLFVFLSS